jgi:hypothetical protein
VRGGRHGAGSLDFLFVVLIVIPGRAQARTSDAQLRIGEFRDSPMCNCTS